MNRVFKCLMMVVRDGRICGGNGIVVGRVMSKRQWGFVLVADGTHRSDIGV